MWNFVIASTYQIQLHTVHATKPMTCKHVTSIRRIFPIFAITRLWWRVKAWRLGSELRYQSGGTELLVWDSFVILFSGSAISEQLHTVFFPFCSSFCAFSLFSSYFGKFCSDYSSHTPTTTLFQHTTMRSFPWISGKSPRHPWIPFLHDSHAKWISRITIHDYIRSLDQHLMCSK